MRKTSFHFHFSFLINLYKEALFCDEVYFVGAATKIKTFDTFYCCEPWIGSNLKESIESR